MITNKEMNLHRCIIGNPYDTKVMHLKVSIEAIDFPRHSVGLITYPYEVTTHLK